MATTVTVPSVMSPSGAGGVDQEDSNISSPLSEVDDKDTNDDDINMHLDDDVDDNASSLSALPQEPNHDGSDSDSVLSDARSVANSDANDTEAETERLYDTPQHQRQRDVVVDQFNEGQVYEHTPSKLRRGITTKEDDEAADEDSLSGDGDGDAASTASSRTDGEELASKRTTTNDTSVDDDGQAEAQDRKRKRSPAVEQSDSEEPLRKRTGSVAVAEADVDGDTAVDDEDGAPGNLASEHPSPAHEEQSTPSKQDTPAEEALSERETRARKSARNGAKRLEKAASASAEENSTVTTEDVHEVVVEEEHEDREDTADVEAEEDAGAAARSAEEAEKKQAAIKDWSLIEERFGVFRDRLYKDRLQRLEEEEQSLLADEPTHPEYLNMKRCLDDRLNTKLQEFAKEQQYRIEALERRAVAERAQVWSQYFQAIREKRESSLEALNKAWYDVQTARRNAHSLQDCGLLFPKDPAQRIRNAVAYNTEVSTLAGIAKYEGFPAGPEIRGASSTELSDDLNAIERARRGRPKPTPQHREEYQAPAFSRLGPAGEQFLKDTPWANPNHSAHKAPQPTNTQPDGREDQGGTASLAAQSAATAFAVESKASVESSVSTQRTAVSARLSESPELARTMLKSAPMKRTGNLSSLGRASKTAAA